MDILVGEQEKAVLLEFISHIKPASAEWKIVEIRLGEEAEKVLGIRSAARMVYRQFSSVPGKLVICSSRDLFLVMPTEKGKPHQRTSAEVTRTLEGYACDVFVDDLANGLSRLEICITAQQPAPSASASLAERRRTRLYNLVFVVDDDFFIRNQIEKVLRNRAVVQHFSEPGQVPKAYDTHAPDMVLLDMHFPVRDGQSLLRELREMDREAYVVMLSADSTRGNVLKSMSLGAKGFLPKPFTPQKLMEYYKQCPTIA